MRRNRQLLIALALFLLTSVSATGYGAIIEKTLGFPDPQVIESGSGVLVNIEGLPLFGNPGEPLLPVYGLRVLLPQGEDVAAITIDLQGEKTISLADKIECAQHQYPLSIEGPWQEVMPDETIYGSAAPFPSQRVRHITTETFRGYNFAFFTVYPVVYTGAESKISFARRITIRIETTPSARLLRRSLGTLRASATDRRIVSRLVDDPSLIDSYSQGLIAPTLSALVDPQETYKYVIITNSTLEPVFEELKELKDKQGLRARIVRLGEISANYTGSDIQEKVRKFIKDAYLNWETEYVLLGGDDEIIPHRGFYAEVSSYTDDDIAADLYYAALDGTWNDDGDSYWGEPEEADLIPEVAVGRAGVGTVEEAANFVNKIIKYETSPVASQVEIAQMVGELLWDDPTWGGDYKDEIKNGSSAHGYTTVGFPPNFTVHTLYDRDIDPDRWDKDDLIPLLNSGRHIVNHLGHSNVIYGLRMYNSDVETSFTNDGVSATYFIIYTQGCYSGSFDNRDPGGLYGDDCLGEHFTFVENAAVAFIGNTRYGWGAHKSTRGANQYYDRQFFDALFGEDITTIGEANNDSRVDNIPFIDFSAMRWVYYQLVLLGDPAMDIWTGEPSYLTVSHPDTVYVGENEVAVTVTDDGAPIEGARVSFMTDTTFSYGFTNSAGVAYIDPRALEVGSVRISVFAHNYYTYLDTIPVIDATHPLIILYQNAIDDDSLGSSSGNSNGKVDAGETIETVTSLKNVGGDTAVDVTCKVLTTDSFVTLLDSMATFGSMEAGSIAVGSNPYVYSVSPACPDSHSINFELEISYSDTTVWRHYSQLVSAPDLVVTSVSLTDTLLGNSDGCIEPGEMIEVVTGFRNRGSGDGYGVSVILSENDPYVTVDSDSASIDTIAPNSEDITSHLISILPECPEFHAITLYFNISYASGRVEQESTLIYVGGSLSDDFEGSGPQWTHSEITWGYTDQWHLETYRNHTSGGQYSWKFGGSGGSNYADYSYGALITPEVCLGTNAKLTFWHFIHAELYTLNSPYAWDGAIVEISVDGGDNWSQIAPVGGYDYKIYPNADSPFEGDTPCFAWTDDWTKVEFDLSAYSGPVRIRFVFGSDGYVADEGWYIDDVVISDDYSSVDLSDKLENVPVRFALRNVTPNPVVDRAKI